LVRQQWIQTSTQREEPTDKPLEPLYVFGIAGYSLAEKIRRRRVFICSKGFILLRETGQNMLDNDST
jgi:hypothetical protein